MIRRPRLVTLPSAWRSSRQRSACWCTRWSRCSTCPRGCPRGAEPSGREHGVDGPPAGPGGDAPVRPIDVAQGVEGLGRRGRRQRVDEDEPCAHAVVVRRPHAEPPEVNEQEHLGRPAADAAHGREPLDDLSIRQLVKVVERHRSVRRLRGQVDDRGGLRPAQADSPQLLHGCAQDGFGRRVPVVQGEEPTVDRPCRRSGQLLEHARSRQGAEGVAVRPSRVERTDGLHDALERGIDADDVLDSGFDAAILTDGGPLVHRPVAQQRVDLMAQQSGGVVAQWAPEQWVLPSVCKPFFFVLCADSGEESSAAHKRTHIVATRALLSPYPRCARVRLAVSLSATIHTRSALVPSITEKCYINVREMSWCSPSCSGLEVIDFGAKSKRDEPLGAPLASRVRRVCDFLAHVQRLCWSCADATRFG